MDLLLKISPDWSVAQKTIAYLEVNNISYYALIMDKSDHIFAQQGKGRPSKRRSEELRLHGELKSEIRRLCKAMAMKPGTDLLLAVSIATTDMQRAVSMFPKVYFMDVIANTNHQKRDLFLLVVKDASGETHVGNLSLLPCGKTWIFTQLYRHFFWYLYGEQTLS